MLCGVLLPGRPNHRCRPARCRPGSGCREGPHPPQGELPPPPQGGRDRPPPCPPEPRGGVPVVCPPPIGPIGGDRRACWRCSPSGVSGLWLGPQGWGRDAFGHSPQRRPGPRPFGLPSLLVFPPPGSCQAGGWGGAVRPKLSPPEVTGPGSLTLTLTVSGRSCQVEKKLKKRCTGIVTGRRRREERVAPPQPSGSAQPPYKFPLACSPGTRTQPTAPEGLARRGRAINSA